MINEKTDPTEQLQMDVLTRKGLVLSPEKQQKITRKIKRLINMTDKNKANLLTDTEIEKQFKKENQSNSVVKRIQNFKAILGLLKKKKLERTKFDIKVLCMFLCEKYDFFKKLKEESDLEKLEACVSALSLEVFERGDRIIKFEEEANKFYILLQGVVGIYKHKFVETEMSLREFIIYLNNIRIEEKNEPKLKRVENENMSIANIELIHFFDYDYTQLPDTQLKKKFRTEEDILISEKSEGEKFGDNAILQKEKRNSTVKAESPCYVASLDKADYNRIIRESEEKKFNLFVDDFRKQYRLLKSWGRIAVIKLLNCCSKIFLNYGDDLYEQNSNSDYIYFIINGNFEFCTSVSISNFRQVKEYLGNTKGSLLTYLLKIGNIPERELETIKSHGISLNGKSPFTMNFSDATFNKRLKPKNEKLVDIKLKEEEIGTQSLPFSVKIRIINHRDIIGLEEALELKKRFYTVRCISTTAELYRIHINDFIFLINRDEIDKNSIRNLIIERKEFLIKQLTNSVKVSLRNKNRLIFHEYDRLLNLKDNQDLPRTHSTLKLIKTQITKSEINKKNIPSSPSGLKDFKFEKSSPPLNLSKTGERKFQISGSNFYRPEKNESVEANSRPFSIKNSQTASFVENINNINSNLNNNVANFFFQRKETHSRTIASIRSFLKNSPSQKSKFDELVQTLKDENGTISSPFRRRSFRLKSQEKVFNSKDYRSSLEKKNFKEIVKEINKVAGNSLITKANSKKRKVASQTFDKRLVSISSMSNLLNQKLETKIRLVSAIDKNILDTEEVSSDYKFNGNSYLYVEKASEKEKIESPIINLKKIINKEPLKMRNSSLKRENIPMEIKMKNFIRLRKKKLNTNNL